MKLAHNRTQVALQTFKALWTIFSAAGFYAQGAILRVSDFRHGQT